eukprot:22562-Pelagococcus_subviridis.AAC.7
MSCPGVAVSASSRNDTFLSHNIRTTPQYACFPFARCASSMTRQTTSFAGNTLEAMSFSIVCGVQKNTRFWSQNALRVPLSSFFVLPIKTQMSFSGMPHMSRHAAFFVHHHRRDERLPETGRQAHERVRRQRVSSDVVLVVSSDELPGVDVRLRGVRIEKHPVRVRATNQPLRVRRAHRGRREPPGVLPLRRRRDVLRGLPLRRVRVVVHRGRGLTSRRRRRRSRDGRRRAPPRVAVAVDLDRTLVREHVRAAAIAISIASSSSSSPAPPAAAPAEHRVQRPLLLLHAGAEQRLLRPALRGEHRGHRPLVHRRLVVRGEARRVRRERAVDRVVPGAVVRVARVPPRAAAAAASLPLPSLPPALLRAAAVPAEPALVPRVPAEPFVRGVRRPAAAVEVLLRRRVTLPRRRRRRRAVRLLLRSMVMRRGRGLTRSRPVPGRGVAI